MALNTRSFVQIVIASSALLLVSACGNPFSKSSDKASIPKNEFHTKTESCNQINFSSERLDEKQLRTVVACLNSNQEIDAFDRLLRSLNSNEIKPLVDLFNSTTEKNPQVFYAVKEMYLRVKQDGRMKEVESLATLLFKNPEQNKKLAQTLKNLAPVIGKWIETQSVELSFESIDQISTSESYQRFVSENLGREAIQPLTASITKYIHASDATSIETLYRLLSQKPVADAFNSMTTPSGKARLEKLAGFFDWMFEKDRFNTLSSALANIQSQKISCFGKIEIKAPLETALDDMSKMTASEAKKYLLHDLKNLVLTARGYCDIPYALDPLSQFLAEATAQSGFEEIYSLIRPLMKDQKFISFLSSQAARDFVQQNSVLAQRHFFQDLLTLIAQVQSAPISKDGQTLARLLDDSLTKLTGAQLENLIEFLRPVLTEDQAYGNHSLHLVRSIVEEFPDLQTYTQPGLRQDLSKLIEAVLIRDDLADVLTLTTQLIREQKLTALIDQTLFIFDRFLNRGKTDLQYNQLTTASFAGNGITDWLLEKVQLQALARDSLAERCRALSYDWDFSVFTSKNQTLYLKQLDLIEACVNTNPTFKAAKAFAVYLISKGQYAHVLQTQKSVVSHAFTLNSDLAFDTFESFLSLTRNQSQLFHKNLVVGSDLIRATGDALLKKKQLRQFVGQQALIADFYQTAADAVNSKYVEPAAKPSLDLMKLNRIDAQITRDEVLTNEDFQSAVDKLFKTYCPTLNQTDGSCDIDDDQVALYRASKASLVKAVKEDYLESSQSWLHPRQFKGWKHTRARPETVADFEYHLNPMLHLVRSGPQSVESALSAVDRIQNHGFDLYRFLRERALRLTLIPYIYQVPNFPVSGKREFHDRIRIRIVSDIDRLELIAINADFKAFGLVQNMGMNFIRELGLSWGDVPESQWPTTLKDLKLPNNVRTLKETRDYIFSEMARFDKGILQKMGECDPRGKTGLGRWIQRQLCSNEVFDISARLFNLRFLIPLIDRELQDVNTPSGGLALLRDLFYSFYEANQSHQFDLLGNGVDVGIECLDSPSLSKEPVSLCNRDLLTYIPRITRLGLLHQIGVAVIKDENTVAQPMIQLLNRLAPQKKITGKLSAFLSTNDGIKTFESGVDFGFKSGEKISSALTSLVPLSNTMDNQNWISAFTDLIQAYPELIADHPEVIEAALSGDGSTIDQIVDSVRLRSKKGTNAWLSQLSKGLQPELMTELAKSLRDLKPSSRALADSIRALQKTPSINSARFNKTTADWLTVLGTEKAKPSRQALANWVNANEFEQFCDVFSDSKTVDQAYNFLDELHQNSDSRAFFQSCQKFFTHP